MKLRKMLIPLGLLLFGNKGSAQGWRTADRSPIGIAPTPSQEKRAVVQIYTARAYSWRGTFGVHPWVAIKRENESNYTVYEVIGFYVTKGVSVIRQSARQPDSRWFGRDPELIYDLRGGKAAAMIPDIEKAVESYPYPEQYRLYPGPNSNTFISHIIRNTPGMRVELPPHAIGKDWLGATKFADLTESKTGLRVSFWGVLGIAVGLSEGIEINIFGMTFGIDFASPALKLPFVGRLGFKDWDIILVTQNYFSNKPDEPEKLEKEFNP
ncbi:MAG: DUF3750 domain-containing protein [Bdellovibrionota bacterium]